MQWLTCRTRNVFNMNKKRKALNNNDDHSLQIPRQLSILFGANQ